jgi:hypothetical protein
LEKVFAAYDGATIFNILPDRQRCPDYYVAIERPISLHCIRSNIERGHYAAVDGIVGGMNQAFDNAMRYNVEGSQVYKDALALQAKVRAAFQRQCFMERPPVGSRLYEYVYEAASECPPRRLEARCPSSGLSFQG